MDEDRGGGAIVWWNQPWVWILFIAIIFILIFCCGSGGGFGYDCK